MEEYDLAKEDEKINDILGFFEPGYKIRITRIRPGWAKGYLEDIELTENNLVDMPYLADQWGGATLRLQLIGPDGKIKKTKDVDFGSYPPRRWGKKITPFRENEELEHRNPTDELEKMLKLAASFRSNEMEMLKAILPQNSQPNSIQQNPVNNLIDTMRQFRELQGIFGEFTSEPSSDSSEMLGTITELAKMVLGARQQNQRMRQQLPQMQQQINIPQKNMTISPDLSDQLSKKSAQEASEIVIQALQRMQPEKRQEAIKSFISSIGDINIDEGTEEYYDEIDEQLSDDTEKNLGKTERTDDRYDPRDREIDKIR